MKQRIVVCTLLVVLALQWISVSPRVLAAEAAEDEEFNVTGRIMSDARTVLSGVLISVYETSSGSLIKMSNTESNGYFLLASLEAGSYDLVFEKAGYISLTVKVSSMDKDVNLGNLQMAPALQLSPTASRLVTTPGQTLVLPFTLKNAGAEAEEIGFTITSPEGWVVSIADENSELTGVRLPAGASTTLNLELEIPQEADVTSEYPLQVTVRGLTTLEWPLTVMVEAEETLLLGCEFPSKSGSLGSRIEFPIQIQNPFDVRTTFRVEVRNGPEAWEVEITNADDESVNAVLLEPNQSSTVVVAVEIPENTQEGPYDFTVTATSPNHIDALRLEVVVTATFDEAEIQAKYPSQSVPLGSTGNYEITIENPSQTNELFVLSATAIPAGWDLVFKAEEEQEIGAVLIAARETETLTVEITPSLNSTLGNYLIPIEAMSPQARGSITLEAIVSGSYAVEVEVDELFVEIQAATTETVTVEVTNTGYSPLTNVELIVTSTPSDEWTVKVSPLKQPTLNPNEAVEFQVSIQVPAEAARGDYLIELQPSMGQLDEDELESQEIRVTVNPETAWGIYGLALVMGAFAVVFLVLMKFRRR